MWNRVSILSTNVTLCGALKKKKKTLSSVNINLPCRIQEKDKLFSSALDIVLMEPRIFI